MTKKESPARSRWEAYKDMEHDALVRALHGLDNQNHDLAAAIELAEEPDEVIERCVWFCPPRRGVANNCVTYNCSCSRCVVAWLWEVYDG